MCAKKGGGGDSSSVPAHRLGGGGKSLARPLDDTAAVRRGEHAVGRRRTDAATEHQAERRATVDEGRDGGGGTGDTIGGNKRPQCRHDERCTKGGGRVLSHKDGGRQRGVPWGGKKREVRRDRGGEGSGRVCQKLANWRGVHCLKGVEPSLADYRQPCFEAGARTFWTSRTKRCDDENEAGSDQDVLQLNDSRVAFHFSVKQVMIEMPST